MKNIPNKIILHHDGVSRSGDSFDVINAFHKDRFNMLSSLGFYVGYHYLIEKTGAIRQARADDEDGAHTKGQNNSSIGICLAGNFDVDVPTMAQVESLGVLLLSLTSAYKISHSAIYPHRMFAAKTCFGMKLPDDWGQRVVRYREAKLALNLTK